MSLSKILLLVNTFLLGFVGGKYILNEFVTPRVEAVNTTIKLDSLESARDSVETEHLGSIKRMGTANLSLVELVNKYEVGLNYLRLHRPDAYMQFIRVAEFKEVYTENIRTDFINEHRRVKRQAAEAFP